MNDTAVADKPPLDELMLAMDVVDTLRHRERVVERALSADERDAELVTRLREIYAGQGIEVSDKAIEQGVRDLRQNRFAYTPTPPSVGRRLATLYVTRGRWGKPVTAIVAIAAVTLVAFQVMVRGPAQAAMDALPGRLEQAYIAVTELATETEVDARAEAIATAGELALAAEDAAGARDAIAELDALFAALDVHYDIRVRSAPGEMSGVWRVPEVNESAQNYYLIVEAIDPDGKPVTLPIVNEETGRTQRVVRWGQRVDQATFDAVAEDKRDDGIIQNRVIGAKPRGVLDPDFRPGVLGGAITDW